MARGARPGPIHAIVGPDTYLAEEALETMEKKGMALGRNALHPVTGKPDFMMVSEAQELALGARYVSRSGPVADEASSGQLDSEGAWNLGKKFLTSHEF